MTPYQEKLVLDHMYLVKNFIRAQIDVRTLPPSIDVHDLYQQGAMILMRAAELYRPGPAKFSTYANKSIRLSLIGYIGNQRWGPKESKRFKMKRNGEVRHEDMLSYDGIPTDEEGKHFLETIPGVTSEADSLISRLTPEMAAKVLESLRGANARKPSKSVSPLGLGVNWSVKDKKYRAIAIVCGKHFHIALFATPLEASAARIEFLNNLEELCEERLLLLANASND